MVQLVHGSRGFVAKSTTDDGQHFLADDVRRIIDSGGIRDFPDRTLILRDPAQGARERLNEREHQFSGAMKELGFEVIYLERLQPLEQMALWSRSTVIVSPHGAGLPHMFFASPSTEVIEIGTPQTQTHRWGDFLQNAHVSRCRYTTIFSDVSRVGLAEKYRADISPSMAAGLLGINFSNRLIDAIERRSAAADSLAAGGDRPVQDEAATIPANS